MRILDRESKSQRRNSLGGEDCRWIWNCAIKFIMLQPYCDFSSNLLLFEYKTVNLKTVYAYV